jgi:hypothetical protein
LEKAANEMLRQSMAGVTKHSEKSDILTPWKEQDRLRREVYVESGVPDGTTRRGNFHRAWNPERPDLNSRDGISRGGRTREMGGSLQGFLDSHQED